MIERRSAGTTERLAATFTSNNNRIVFLAAYGWSNYGNGAAPVANTNEYDLDGIYRFSPYKGTGPYKGSMLRDRYFVRTIRQHVLRRIRHDVPRRAGVRGSSTSAAFRSSNTTAPSSNTTFRAAGGLRAFPSSPRKPAGSVG